MADPPIFTPTGDEQFETTGPRHMHMNAGEGMPVVEEVMRGGPPSIGRVEDRPNVQCVAQTLNR